MNTLQVSIRVNKYGATIAKKLINIVKSVGLVALLHKRALFSKNVFQLQ